MRGPDARLLQASDLRPPADERSARGAYSGLTLGLLREQAEQHCQVGNSEYVRGEVVCWLAKPDPGAYQRVLGGGSVKLIFAVILASLLTGCAADTMRTYVGQDIRNVELAYGPPINQIDLGNG